MREIELTQGKVAIVDDEDYEYLSKWKWVASFDPSYNSFKATTSDYKKTLCGVKTIFMHRYVMGFPNGLQVDHINHNTLDNRKCNLRVATGSQNSMNRRKIKGTKSIYKGVRYRYSDNRIKHYQAIICLEGKRISLGFFEDEKMAALAYDEKARELFGEFAKLNFPAPE